MFYALGVIEIIISIILCIYFFHREGIIFIVDGAKIMSILWMVVIGFYNLALSSLYKPSLEINIICIIIIIPFIVLSFRNRISKDDIKNIMDEFYKIKWEKGYNLASIVIIVISLLCLYLTYKKYGLIILTENRIVKQELFFSYGLFLAVMVSQIQFLIFIKRKRVINFLGCCTGFIIMSMIMKRGPIFYILLVIITASLFNAIYKNKVNSKKVLIALISVLLTFMLFFGVVGNFRTETIMKDVYSSTNSHFYEMKNTENDIFSWAYIYATSPIENARYAIENQHVNYTYFKQLLYSPLKYSLNFIGMGEEFSKSIENREYKYYPYLKATKGLNVSSFIYTAFEDCGIIGLLVYVSLYVLLYIMLLKLLKSKVSCITKILVYSNALNIFIWSIFTNSFNLGVVWVYIGVSVILNFITKIFRLKIN